MHLEHHFQCSESQMSMRGCHSTIRAGGRLSQGHPSLPACGTHRGCSQGLLVAAGGSGETQGNIPSERLEWQTWIQKGAMHLPLLLKTFRAPQASYHMESSTSNGAYLDLSGNPRGAHLHPSSSFTLLVASCASQHTKSHTDTGSDPWESPKKL